jgi:hypothetical protein
MHMRVHELSAAARASSLQADTEMVSLDPGSLNSPEDIQYWAQGMHRRRIKPDVAIFEVSIICSSMELVEKGWSNHQSRFVCTWPERHATDRTRESAIPK